MYRREIFSVFLPAIHRGAIVITHLNVCFVAMVIAHYLPLARAMTWAGSDKSPGLSR